VGWSTGNAPAYSESQPETFTIYDTTNI